MQAMSYRGCVYAFGSPGSLPESDTFPVRLGCLIVAYVIHFPPAGLQSLEPALQQITPNLEESGRTLGSACGSTWKRVTLPLMRNGFIVAWVLMFLQTMKELP